MNETVEFEMHEDIIDKEATQEIEDVPANTVQSLELQED